MIGNLCGFADDRGINAGIRRVSVAAVHLKDIPSINERLKGKTMRSFLSKFLAITLLAASVAFVPAGAARAKVSQPATHNATHKKSFVQRHPTLTSVGAGYAAYKAAKITGKNRTRAGGKKNFAQRHPVLTGIGAGMVTHHVIKKNMKK